MKQASTFFFALMVVCAAWFGACSSPLEGVGVKPAAPAAPALQAQKAAFLIQWEKTALAESYQVYISTAENPPAAPVKTGVTGNSVTLDGLVNGTAYSVWIQAVNTVGASPLSGVTRKTLDMDAPLITALTAGDGQLTVSWNAVEFADSYNLYCGAVNTRPETPALTGVTQTTAVIGSLANDMTYYVWVQPVNAGGASRTFSPAGQARITPSYAITYNLGGGTNNPANPADYTFDTADIPLAAPQRLGYTFTGWYDNSAYSGSIVTTIPRGSSGNKTLYAAWSPVNYTITYILNGGTITEANPPTYTVETPITGLRNPSKTNYTFVGWYDNAAFTGSAVTSISIGTTGNLTLYAKWSPVNFTITYTLNGGTNSAQNPASYTVETAAITLAAPTRSGYTFMGWYDNEAFTGAVITGIASGSTGNRVLYARWSIITYTITYSLNGGTITETNPSTYTVETPAIILHNPSKTNYTFAGWYSAANFSGSAITSIAAGTTGNLTLYARWSPVSFSITYVLNGGANSSQNPTSYTVETAAITLRDPGRSGYTFAGWYNDAAFTGSVVLTIPTGSTGNRTLYARWTVITYTITYILDGGTNNAANPATYTVATPTIVLQNPTRSGYSFLYWSEENASVTNTIPIGSTGNKTFTARWNGPPAVPASLSVTSIGQTTVELSWVYSSGNGGIEGFRIYIATSAAGTYTLIPGSPGWGWAEINNLSRNTTYYFKVSAYNAYGESAQSTYVSARTQ